jgi:transcriptional repressor NrdR
MKCPSCGFEDSKVIDSRTSDGGSAIRRRRECPECSFRFTTFERMQTTNLMVEKKDGSAEAYDREKLERGILVACGKRPVSIEKIREKLSELEEKWAGEKIISSQTIGKDIVEMLRQLDDVAFIRFASVYKEFKDVETFKQEISNIFKHKS